MRDVAVWLEGLGLGKYARAFEDNEIDFEALPHLTDRTLEQIGLPVGARIKLLAAISALAPSPPSAAAQKGEERPIAERRQITVMFCDLVDSTRLARRLDPEDLRSVMQTYQKACRTVIERFHGHVAQYLGDGVMAYFGWPAAREDAAESAVRAGLEVIEAVKALATPEPSSVRVGISTGVVVISETGDPSNPFGAVGETPNMAAHLQALAAPNSVVIAEATSRLTWGRFDQEAMGPQQLKGVAEPVPVFRVQRVRDESIRFQAAHIAALTPLVDRRTELALLQERWLDATDGEGQVVFVSGVPGIGKSRIVHELEQWIGDPHFTLRFQCLPHCMQSALFPVIQQIERLAELNAEDSDEKKLDKIKRLLSRATQHPDRAVPFLAEMISIPFESRYVPPALSAEQVKAQTLFVLVELLLGLAERRPVFCLLEDAQWIDPSTQELLDLLVRQVGKARILLIVTHRPEYHERAGVHSNVTALTISRLRRRDVAELAQRALRNQSVSKAVVETIIDKSDSIPLFIEELARSVIDAGGMNEHRSYDDSSGQPGAWAVPDSLRDSLVARLDRAPKARSLAQIAAVVGREFSYEMLLRVSSLSQSELDAALAHLEQSEIVQQIANGRSARYIFKHALLRDAAYESLLKSTRRAIHARVGAIIEKEWLDIVSGQPELLAYHYSLAENPALALRYWLLGGRRARGRSANLEAAGQFQKALESLDLLPETRERNETELEIQLSLGLCFIAVRGYSADETRRAFERACILSAQLGERYKEIQAIYGVWGHYWMRAEHQRAIGLAETMLRKGEALHDPTALVVGYRSLGSTLFTLGDFARSQEYLEQAMSLSQRANSEGLSLSYAVDPRIAAQLILAWDLWILGYPARALDNALEALEHASRREDPYSIAFAHYVTSAVRLLRGEPRDSLEHADRSLALSNEHRINLYALYSRFGRGCALSQMGEVQRAMSEIRSGIEEARRSNLGYLRAFMLGCLAAAQAEAGDTEAGLSTIDEAFKHINDNAGRAWEAEARRLRGDILLMARPQAIEEAERVYQDAIAAARRQRARSWELRATTSLARLLRTQGKNDEARRILAPVYGWFTEGLDTADLRQAKRLLDELE